MNPVWTREDAERIARDHLAASRFLMFDDAVFTVRTLAEAGPLALYGPEILPRSLASALVDKPKHEDSKARRIPLMGFVFSCFRGRS